MKGVNRLLEAMSGRKHDWTPQEEWAYWFAWGTSYVSIFLGLIFHWFLPIYSAITGILCGFVGLIWLRHISPEMLLRYKHDEEWWDRFNKSEHWQTLLNGSIGVCRFTWEYHRLPLPRQFADYVITGPMSWPFILNHLIKYWRSEPQSDHHAGGS